MTIEGWIAIVVSILIAVVGQIGGFLVYRSARKRFPLETKIADAESEKFESEAELNRSKVAYQVIESLKDEVGRLSARVNKLEEEGRKKDLRIAKQGNRIRILEKKIKELGGIVPPPNGE